MVVKDGAALEAMGQTRTVLMDKTGTLTAGRAHVVAVATSPGSQAADVLALAASVEQASPHVLAAMLVREAPEYVWLTGLVPAHSAVGIGLSPAVEAALPALFAEIERLIATARARVGVAGPTVERMMR